MNNVVLLKLDLNDQVLRFKYSRLLQNMEVVFKYPLGESQFLIRHGFGNHLYDYFSYFEQLGEPYFYVIKENHQIIGSLCCVLREINRKKVWYICDLKLIPFAQFKKIPKLLYLLLHKELLAITEAFYFVNMSPEKNNGLYSIAQHLMVNFSLDIKPYYIYEFTSKNIGDGHIITHNQGKKDIVINDNILDLYHVIGKASDRCNHIQYSMKSQLTENSVIMLGSTKLIKNYKLISEGIFVSCNFSMNIHLSTFEI